MTRRHLILLRRPLAFALLGLLFSFVACDPVGEGCGPFKETPKTTGFTTATYRIGNADSLDTEPVLAPIESDTLASGELSIQMILIKEAYSSASKAEKRKAIRFVSAAYACSPALGERVQDIQIYSDHAFNSEYAAGDNLAALFDVIVRYRVSPDSYFRFDLNDFLSGAPGDVSELVFVLKAAPQATSGFQFTVRYFQEGGELDYYEFKTAPVVLRTD